MFTLNVGVLCFSGFQDPCLNSNLVDGLSKKNRHFSLGILK